MKRNRSSKCPVCTAKMELVKLDINQGIGAALLMGASTGFRLEIVRKEGKRQTVMTDAKNKAALYCQSCGLLAVQAKPVQADSNE